MIFYKNKQPIISIPTDNSLKIAWVAVGCFPSRTFVRKFFKISIYLRVVLYFLIKPLMKSHNRLDEILVVWFKDTQKLFNNKLHPVFIWSLVKGRKRYYVHLLDEKGNKCYFAKITAKKQDYVFLETEKKQLEHFANAKTFSVPIVKSFTQNNRYCSLITHYLDAIFKLRHPDTYQFPIVVANEIASKTQNVLYADIVKFDWHQKGYQRIKQITNYNKFINAIDHKKPVTISQAHGDFGGENIFTDNKDKLCVIDWESFTSNAPYLTDKIAYWLGSNHKNIKNNSVQTYKNFIIYFKNEQDNDVALALLFLISVDFNLAYILVKEWKG